ncbi:MAG: hypothetical protein KAG61_06445 [Bacteriovoracaceae bacterium]|nr:hypothetical protein [Bacteriovoracaceae bacterium]
MKLLIFAHRFEAQHFFTQFNFKSIVGKIDNLYIDKDKGQYLLITGAGIINSSSKIARVLERFENIEHIYNLGVCGKLTKETIPHTFKVKVSNMREEYKVGKDSIELASEGLRCLSSLVPVFDKELSVKLSRHAEVIDMELYGIAVVARQFKISLTAIKTVSDSADDSAKDLNFKKEAPLWSKRLFDHYSSE